MKDLIKYIKAYKIKTEGPNLYLFLKNNEFYHCFRYVPYPSSLDSICSDFGAEIDSTFDIVIGNQILFDTIYYANFCYEKTIIHKLSICLTRNESFIHCCTDVDQINTKFVLEKDEMRILNQLLSDCSIRDSCNDNKTYLFDNDYAINFRIRVVCQGNHYDLYLSDSHKEYNRYALLNSFLLGLSKKYSSYDGWDEVFPIFLMPVW